MLELARIQYLKLYLSAVELDWKITHKPYEAGKFVGLILKPAFKGVVLPPKILIIYQLNTP